MKKLFFGLATAAVLAGGLGSCQQNGGGSVKLSNQVDSASYAFGQQQGGFFSGYVKNVQERGSVSLDEKALLQGISDGLADTTKFSYAQGVVIGTNLAQNLVKELGLDPKAFTAAFLTAAKGDSASLQLPAEQLDSLVRVFEEKARAEKMEKEFGKNKTEGKEFIEKFKAEHPEAKTTESGLVYIVKEEGKGESPVDGDNVKVNYEGKLVDGTVFDSSYTRKEPVEFNINGVIPGWTEMLKLMKPGGKVTVVIPYDKAYGSQDMGQIKPFSTLVFDIELLSIKKD